MSLKNKRRWQGPSKDKSVFSFRLPHPSHCRRADSNPEELGAGSFLRCRKQGSGVREGGSVSLLRTKTQDRSPPPPQPEPWVPEVGLLLRAWRTPSPGPFSQPLTATSTLGPLDFVSDPPEFMPGEI